MTEKTAAEKLASSIMADITDDYGELRSYAYAEKQIAKALAKVASGATLDEVALKTREGTL